MPASIGPIEVVEVVTRYGAKHLAIKDRHDDAMSRYFTACMGTSSWTIESWAANPDHPLGLTADEMVGLDLCTRCVAILRPEPEAGDDQVQAALDRANGKGWPTTPQARIAHAFVDRRVLAAEVERLAAVVVGLSSIHGGRYEEYEWALVDVLVQAFGIDRDEAYRLIEGGRDGSDGDAA